ncbi:hypothetical protein J5N97_020562 [Dioscorea zingiberensis]|uniref:Uncharacterized protein n=1 Tax=Dioscorea zingiberensis TaxID=325984 RepID=A0A9D5HDW1_9LILI|nr:hypothetical protein J5N97_020562 [Dioscorea zingiberensis]
MEDRSMNFHLCQLYLVMTTIALVMALYVRRRATNVWTKPRTRKEGGVGPVTFWSVAAGRRRSAVDRRYCRGARYFDGIDSERAGGLRLEVLRSR